MHVRLMNQRACANLNFLGEYRRYSTGSRKRYFMLIRGIYALVLVGVYGQHPSDEQPLLFPCVCAFGMSASEASAGIGITI